LLSLQKKIMDIFKGQNILEFSDKFKTDTNCYEYLSELKWANGYKCSKCGGLKYTVEKDGKMSRQCHKCHHIESPSSGTLFHKIKFGMRKAFLLMFEMTATTKGLSASQAAKRYSITRKTSGLFMHKVRIAMKSSETMPINTTVQVDEFVFGGKEDLKQGRSTDVKKKKLVVAVELSENKKVKRVYFDRLDDFSSNSLKNIFEKHISTDAQVYTDKWSGYKPLMSTYSINAQQSNNGSSMKQIHIIIHQVKSWLRSVFSWVHKDHIQKYLDEYSFRINRSIYKETIFHKLASRMMEHEKTDFKAIKIRC